MRDVNPEGIDWLGAMRVDPPGKRKPDYLMPGDVIFTSRGTRNLAVAVADIPCPAIGAPNLFVIRLGQASVCLPNYLAWFMNQRPAQDYFQRSATGTNILNIRREVVEQLAVPVPSLRRQKAIAEFDATARLEREVLRGLIKNRDQQMEALALGLAGCGEALL
jgi:restriction endonuclease S subunit